MENKEQFSYTYSAAQQQEIENIRKKYLPREEDKMAQLRALHRRPGRKAQSRAITLGVIGALILGTGMSICMTDLGARLGAFGMLLGVITGLVGMVLVALSWPVYNRVLRKEQTRIAPEILRLSEELLR